VLEERANEDHPAQSLHFAAFKAQDYVAPEIWPASLCSCSLQSFQLPEADQNSQCNAQWRFGATLNGSHVAASLPAHGQASWPWRCWNSRGSASEASKRSPVTTKRRQALWRFGDDAAWIAPEQIIEQPQRAFRTAQAFDSRGEARALHKWWTCGSASCILQALIQSR
jgi:hypothetical protein